MSSFVPVKSRQGSKVFHEDVDRYKSIEIGLIGIILYAGVYNIVST